jgi:hypothetical protein
MDAIPSRSSAFRFAVVAAAVALLVACGIPVEVTTDTQTVTLPVSPSLIDTYEETLLELPEEARQEGLIFDQVLLHYTVTTTSTVDATVTIYASAKQSTDDTPDGDELLIEETVQDGETATGTTESDELRKALNERKQYVVIGGEASSITGTGFTGTGDITVEVYAEISGRVTAP